MTSGAVSSSAGACAARVLGLALVLALAACRMPSGPDLRRVGEDERRAYQQALALRSQQPTAAARALEGFLATWPRSPLADDAALALAEVRMELGEEEAALRGLHRAIAEHPRGNRTDEARVLLAQLQLRRGHPQSAGRTLAPVRLSALSPEARRRAHRVLADLSEARGEEQAQLRWVGALYAEAADDDERALLDTEIDGLVMRLDEEDLRRAALEIGERAPVERLRLRLAELALARGDLRQASDELELVRRFELDPFEAERLERLEARLGLRQVEPEPLPPRLVDLRSAEGPDASRAAGTLGAVLPLSGSYADFGEQALQGLLLATQMFDAEIPRGQPSHIRVRVRDSQSTAEGAERAVRELARDPDVSAIVGPLAIAETEGAARAAREERIPLLSLSRSAAVSENPYALRLGLSLENEARVLASFAVEELGARRFAILYPRDGYGRRLRTLFWDAVEARGGELVGVVGYAPDATDFSDAIRRLVGYVLLTSGEQRALSERRRLRDRAKRLPPDEARAMREQAAALTAPGGAPLPPIVDFDVLFVPDSYENAVLIAPGLAFQDVEDVQLLGTSGWNDPDLVRIGQRHVEDVVFTAAFHREYPHPLCYEFARRFERSFGAPPTGFSAEGFDAANLVIGRWIEGADSPEEVRRSLLGLRNQPGVSGVLSIGPDGVAVRRPHLLTVRRGEIVPLD